MLCELCGRERETTSHHLIPKQIHSKKWCKKSFSKDEMKQRRANLCRDCHSCIHRFYTNSELGKYYNTVEKLLAIEKVVRFTEWVKKQHKKAKK